MTLLQDAVRSYQQPNVLLVSPNTVYRVNLMPTAISFSILSCAHIKTRCQSWGVRCWTLPMLQELWITMLLPQEGIDSFSLPTDFELFFYPPFSCFSYLISWESRRKSHELVAEIVERETLLGGWAQYLWWTDLINLDFFLETRKIAMNTFAYYLWIYVLLLIYVA
jgi:hypothetical protein